MRKTRVLALAFALVAALADASDPMYIYVEDAQAVGTTNVVVAFTNNHSAGAGETFTAAEVFIKNTGSVTMYVDLDGVATVGDFPLLAGEAFTFGTGDTGIASIGVITASSTTTCTILATRPK